jgi:dihydrodipicolinate reductase
MTSAKRIKIAGGVTSNSVGIEYGNDILQEATNLKDGEVKLIPKVNGDGHIILTRFGNRITIVTNTYTRRIFRKTVITNTTEINERGVFVDGRKI